MSNVLIDAREMLPPEPLERALAALDQIGAGDNLTLMLNQRPYPLFLVLAKNGFSWNEAEEESGGFRYRIFRA